MKKLLWAVLAALALLLCFPASALADEAYDIEDDDVHIIVSDDNTISMVDRLTVNYTQERHGIYYYVQYKGAAVHEVDGQLVQTEYQYDVSDFDVSGCEFSLSREDDGEDGYLVAKIGDPDVLVIGEQQYEISYTCEAGDNGVDTFDEFYRNLIMCGEKNTIENASFVIELPRDFDESDVELYLGAYGTGSSEGVTWEKDGDTIKGHITRPMQGGEILTARIVMSGDSFNDGIWIGIVALFVLARLL